MKRAYYTENISTFIDTDMNKILGELTASNEFSLEGTQKNAWIKQIEILKEQLKVFQKGQIIFEYSIPRMGKRVDVILLLEGIIFVLEFKVGNNKYDYYAIEQVLDYALDLKNFHEHSHARKIIPVLIATEAPQHENKLIAYEDMVFHPLKANKINLSSLIAGILTKNVDTEITSDAWLNSNYKPTPTIIEAAQVLYHEHNVREISRSDAGAINLGKTSDVVSEIINTARKENKKSICFITGVPGSGKTLAGLNIANEKHNIDEGEHTVFLSGNGPLVKVLQEALARNKVDKSKNIGIRVSKSTSLRETKSFIQNIHHFRDDAILNKNPRLEHVVVFDEAQRAWTKEQTSSFMNKKKELSGFEMSEPEFLIGVLDRHSDWAVIICLIGGGQEINVGEAGLSEWFNSLQRKYNHWHVYISDKITDMEYTNGEKILDKILPEQLHVIRDLHLSVSMRSYRSEKVSELIKTLLDIETENAKNLYAQIRRSYPIYITRNFVKAKNWLNNVSRGSERTGIIASSGAYRLKSYGINIKSEIDPKIWFLNRKDDVRSSNFLEDVATEFDIQGLELDWTCVAWDADFRYNSSSWEYKSFQGTKWNNIKSETNKRYLKNTYRVLLTRARQGMVIFVPEGCPNDYTRLPVFYDTTFNYLLSLGFQTI